MATSVLLVHDDIAAIAAVRRLLAREGYDVVLATSAVDAITLFHHHPPALVVLSPAIEGGRGAEVLAEFSAQAEVHPFRLVLLGTSLEGVAAPTVSLPLDGAAFLDVVRNALGAAGADLLLEAALEQTHQQVEAETLAMLESVLPGAEAEVTQEVTRIEAWDPFLLQDPGEPPGALEPEALRTGPPRRVKRAGTASLEEFARLVLELGRAEQPIRLELASDEGQRVLRIARGRLVGAQSSVPQESLLDRARQDGLIDSRQRAELRLLGLASTAELLEAMRHRGYLREAEVVPLLQRHAEQIALHALSEARTDYQWSEDAAREPFASASARSLLHLVCEGLRRGLSPDGVLGSLGGLGARPELEADAPAEIEELDFSEGERDLLRSADGELSLQELLLSSGLSQPRGLAALAIAKTLGVVVLRPAQRESPPPLPDLDVRRLGAKYEEVDSADYFALLGVPRSAGRVEVEQAYQHLSSEFHPMRFASHPDPELHRRAERVRAALEEAAAALQDDVLRSQYAQNLLD